VLSAAVKMKKMQTSKKTVPVPRALDRAVLDLVTGGDGVVVGGQSGDYKCDKYCQCTKVD
jgi:hypothetical protein